MIGRHFGELVVESQAPTRYYKNSSRPNGLGKAQRFWIVRCSCGSPPFEISEKALLYERIRDGVAPSAIRCKSCIAVEYNAQKTHGESGLRTKVVRLSETPEYRTWKSIHNRCYNKKYKHYRNYGERGICVCERWYVYENFLMDMGRRPSVQHSIERRNNNLDYSPDNCFWATVMEQNRNKRTNDNITINGRTQCATDWIHECGLKKSTYYSRLKAGKSVLEALGLE